MSPFTHRTLIELREFLMRLGMYNSRQFSRDEVRKEAANMLYSLDDFLREEVMPKIPSRGAQAQPKARKMAKEPKPVESTGHREGHVANREPEMAGAMS